ncbi:TPA: 1-deoxy-D-xylulose-5-phosphate synthase [Patescibacteria group bacterium]|uniref:1-deoxy-D-xylulose-5-phosphate synthase n=1 Tax=Candidatus Gottesmanbacteria bacterium GW2011_GWA1_43_11 TaxID=1618436 RepID=A0A0G1ET97_9BACT|nr:MAG: 1-deoxy-D-xylulose-5-phosphate synthase [Candidatus Gottesmanbacteria bacterium GW2011_GWA1_43_11]HCS79090.1 1-deoxy-D-xylulose-5-phosphate synthase [Patescibacteria group bacterium]
MRKVFIQTLIELAKRDERIVLLTGDLGYTVIEPFQKSFPGRFFNVGVAEQNLIGIATGLAANDFIPFVYSIATFVTLRPYEFIRNGPVLHNLPVRIVGVGGGFEYGKSGKTHHAIEDIGLMRLQRGMNIFVPADSSQTKTILEETWDISGPTYYRIGKQEQTLGVLQGKFKVGTLQIIKKGTDIGIFVCGSLSLLAEQVFQKMNAVGISTLLAVVASISPPPKELKRVISSFSLVATIESHQITGGLGSLVSETIVENGLKTRLLRFGISQPLDSITGSEEYLLNKYHLNEKFIVSRLVKIWKKKI